MRLAVLAVLLALSACKPGDDPPPDPQATAAKPAPTILDDQLKTMEKARAVEQDVLDSAKKTDEVLDAAEGGKNRYTNAGGPNIWI